MTTSPSLLAFCFAAILSPSQAGADDAELSKEHFRRGGQPCAIVHYGDFNGVFLVDTGATTTSVSGPRALHDSPDPKWRIYRDQVQYATGVRTVNRISGITVSAFGTPAVQTVVNYREWQSVEKSGFIVSGILGVPEFRRFPLRFDLQNHVCSKYDEAMPPKNTTNLHVVEHWLGVSPKVMIELPVLGKRPVIFDTGFSRSLALDRQTIERLVRAGQMKVGPTVQGVTPIGEFETKTFILRSVKLGEFQFRDIQVAELDLPLVGCELFQAFDMVVDLSHDNIWLKPHEKKWPVRIPPDASGLVMTYYDANLLKVVRMQPDSPAIHCGLQEGDQVLTFDGKMPKDLSMLEIKKRLTQAGSTVPLKILRDNKQLEINLPLSYSFEYPPKWPDANPDADAFLKSIQSEKSDAK